MIPLLAALVTVGLLAAIYLIVRSHLAAIDKNEWN